MYTHMPLLKFWKSFEDSRYSSDHLGCLPAHSPFDLDLDSLLLHSVPRLLSFLWSPWALTSFLLDPPLTLMYCGFHTMF